jgi:hypothetical protein
LELGSFNSKIGRIDLSGNIKEVGVPNSLSRCEGNRDRGGRPVVLPQGNASKIGTVLVQAIRPCSRDLRRRGSEAVQREIELPRANADDYLRWMAYWRDVESSMLERPALEHLASSESAPFLRGEVARTLSDLARKITVQAQLSRDDDQPCVPRIEVKESFLVEIADYMERRGAWLQTYCLSMAIPPLEPRLCELRKRVISTIRSEAGQPAVESPITRTPHSTTASVGPYRQVYSREGTPLR